MARKKKKKAAGEKERSRTEAGAHPLGEEPVQPGQAPEADEPPVIDLDEDADADDLVAALVAEALATPDEGEELEEPEPPVIDLDAEGRVDAEAEVELEGESAAALGQAADPALTPHRASRTPEEPAADRTLAGESAASPAELTPEEALRRLVELGPVSSPEIRDRLLAEALAHAEHKDARYRVPFTEAAAAGRWKALVGFMILLLAGLAAIAPPSWARPEPPARLEAPDRAQSLRVALLLQAEQIEGFRVREQRLPVDLEEVGDVLPGVRYVRSGSRAYQLIGYMPDGSAIVYDSAVPAPAFEALEPGWRPAEGAS